MMTTPTITIQISVLIRTMTAVMIDHRVASMSPMMASTSMLMELAIKVIQTMIMTVL